MLINMFQGYASHAGGSGFLYKSSFLSLQPLIIPACLPAVGREGKNLEVGPLAGRASNLLWKSNCIQQSLLEGTFNVPGRPQLY